jgi:hypothetical protein
MLMRGKLSALVILGVGCAAAALVSATAMSQPAASGLVRYTMDAATVSGFGAMSSGGGLGAVLGMMRGGAPQPARMLTLRHSAGTTAPRPEADHFMPEGARLGEFVRLLPPPQGETGRERGSERSFEPPSGRLLLYWGCGERAAPGQPVVIDFAKLAAGQIPPDLLMSGADLSDDWEEIMARSATYTTWPNGKDSKAVPANASLIGAHRIAANYTPKEISFTLAEDFMPPLLARTTPLAGGATRLAWGAVDRATGYYAWAIGTRGVGRGGKPAEMVWWASSKNKAFGGPLWDWIAPTGVRKLIAAGTVMPPEQHDCAIPAEVIKAGGEAMVVNLQAYGPQVDFAYPPRPADTRKPWKPEWLARVRFRSSTMLIPGMEGMAGASGAAQGDAMTTPEAKPKKPKCKGLKGLAERAAGLCE